MAGSNSCPSVARGQVEVIRTFTHLKPGFTEGLVYFNDKLYESTGNISGTRKPGKSVLNEIDPVTGAVRVLEETPKNDFGEGLALLNGTFYQLTYTEKNVYAYGFHRGKLSFEAQHELPMKEGWGLTTDGQDLIASDGSDRLYFLDPNSLQVKKELTVQATPGRLLDRKKYSFLNELEYVAGKVYANLFKTDLMISIDARSGCVEEVFDLSLLRDHLTPREREVVQSDQEYVLNGIAHKSQSGHFYIFGKMWPRFFEVKLS